MKKKTFLDGLSAEAREKVIAGAATGCENHDTDVLAFRIGDMLPRNTNTLTGTTSEQWDAERELYHVELTRRNVAAIEALEDRITKLEAQRAPQPSKSNEARDAAVMDYCNSIATAHTRATTSISANTREAYAGGRRIGPEPAKAAENTREPAKAKPWCSHLKVNFAPLHPVTGADDHQYHATEAEAYEHLVTSLRVQRDTLKAEYEALQKRHETYVRESEAVITDLRKRLNGGEA